MSNDKGYTTQTTQKQQKGILQQKGSWGQNVLKMDRI